MRGASATIAICTLALLALWFARDRERVSPGPLAPVHARLDELRGLDGCEACHARGRGELCAGCHEPIAARLAESRGLHGELDAERAVDCGHCHVEHLGGAIALSGPLAFARTGYERIEDYDHRGLSIDRDGRHAELDCVDCHALAARAHLADDGPRYLMRDASCRGCHEDPHDGALEDCLRCHAPDAPFEALSGYVHDERCPLMGGHGELECTACHEPGGARSVEAVGAQLHPPARRCVDCHEQPHDEVFLSLVRAARPGDGGECTPCHRGEHESFSRPIEVDERGAAETWHALTGFALEAGHAGLDCRLCHGAGEATGRAASFSASYPGRAADDCEACHDGPHGRQFAAGPPGAERGCVDCHTTETFRASSFDFRAHARTSFTLDQAHAAVPCAECHAPTAGASPPATSTVATGGPTALPTEPEGPDFAEGRFAGADARWRLGALACADCHEDSHRARLVLPRGERAGRASPDIDCGHCHDRLRFDRVASEDFAHDESTHFALDGAHAEAACESCHREGDEIDSEGRRFGFVADLFGEPVGACVTCHLDAHEGRLVDREAIDVARAGATGARLADAVPRDANADDRTTRVDDRIARVGARAAVGVRRDGSARARSASAADANDATLDRDAGQACALCHSTNDFHGPADFAHARWTGFALRGQHARAECESCHARSTAPDEAGRTFGRAPALFPRPLDGCAGCHADVHAGAFDGRNAPLGEAVVDIDGHLHEPLREPLDEFASAESTARAPRSPIEAPDCDACHDEERFDSRPTAFDHELWTDFRLVGAHAALDCEACHERAARPDEDGRRFGRARGRECRDCHGDPHGGQFETRDAPTEGRSRAARPGSASVSPRAADDAEASMKSAEPATAPGADRAAPRAARSGRDAARPESAGPPPQPFQPFQPFQPVEPVARGCARCHAAHAEEWSELDFEHDRDSVFALDAVHARLECARCHRVERPLEGPSVVRYKPLGTRCADCHSATAAPREFEQHDSNRRPSEERSR